MLHFKNLSFWEKQYAIEGIDFLVVGSGITGAACALSLRKKYPDAKIVILERGYLPSGASTKNAGFTCFGSVTELAEDLENSSSNLVWETVALRYEGLRKLMERFPETAIGYQACGSYDLITETPQKWMDLLPDFNQKIQEITGTPNVFSWRTEFVKSYGFKGFEGGFHNQLEGAINTRKLWDATVKELVQAGIILLNGIEVLTLEASSESVSVQTNFGELQSAHVLVATNGLSKKLLPELALSPARAQVIVTSPIEKLPFHETYHYDSGYYYFRTIGNRILLGGGRNLDFEGETTTEFGMTAPIKTALIQLLQEQIIPGKTFSIDYEWSGIMGVGNEKKPIIQKIHPRIAIGVRLGGMGVAIGSLVGENLAELVV